MTQSTIKLTNRVGVLCQICNSIASGEDLEKVEMAIYNLIREIIPLDLFYIGYYIKKEHVLDLMLIMDEGVRYPRVSEPIRNGVVEQVIIKKTTICYHRSEDTENSFKPRDLILPGNKSKFPNSILASPLLIPGQIIGVIGVQRYDTNIYSETEVKLMDIVTTQIASALETSNKYTDAEYFNISDKKRGYKKISEKKSLQVEYDNLLIQYRKLKSIINLVAMISHEMNQPLTGISGYCTLMKEELNEEHTLYQDLNQIQKQARRLERLITELQNFVHLESFNYDHN